MYGSHHQQPENYGQNDVLDPFLVKEPSMMHAIHGLFEVGVARSFLEIEAKRRLIRRCMPRPLSALHAVVVIPMVAKEFAGLPALQRCMSWLCEYGRPQGARTPPPGPYLALSGSPGAEVGKPSIAPDVLSH